MISFPVGIAHLNNHNSKTVAGIERMFEKEIYIIIIIIIFMKLEIYFSNPG